MAHRSRRRKSDGATVEAAAQRGWTLFNDIPTRYGNIDHALVGPAGIFVLESKRLAGTIKVGSAKLVVRWHEDPEDGYENDTIARRAKRAAFDLHSRLGHSGVDSWVQAVVVLWGDFGQRSIEQDDVAWVRGDVLADVLAERPVKYSGDALDKVASAARMAVATLRDD